MSTQEHDPAREALAELHVEIRLDESLRAMALADIKAPLMEVSLSASVAERIAGAHLDGRLRDAIRDIRESAARAIALLSGLADETSLNVDLRVIDVSEVVGMCLRAAQPLAKARGVHIETALAPGSTRGLGDRLRTTRALVTVICVCLRRSRPGDRVRLEISNADRGCAVTVTDAGPRLTSDEVEALLSPVLASDGGLPTRDLSRALRATVVQGGLLRVEPAGDGMAFILELPPPPHR
jgi:C4-dicarboxylate-specific signal transduction histidine kinase